MDFPFALSDIQHLPGKMKKVKFKVQYCLENVKKKKHLIFISIVNIVENIVNIVENIVNIVEYRIVS